MEQVRYEVEGAVARITIDRPERHNAMSFQVMQELAEALELAKADDGVRVVVLTGAGERAFCAGADLGGIGSNAGPARMHEARGGPAALFKALWHLGKPTIARVRGYCLAGGFGSGPVLRLRRRLGGFDLRGARDRHRPVAVPDHGSD